ncbi:hypothetical protein [Pantoea stewartii]|uniref:Uncharacterized protein n=1 Tax=Pantoea stewartii subsp. stewartii DC283 TaxID=660596 RepID=H3RLL7_PANSE|nr:hypothetical protein [Pantoea stewartii]ARF52774.1 hypothetical protein DSJ_26565 [Pantoea stewartii subsp. stewartii DC283]EHT97730.1 hypothetical protein CKS_5592 [Pantoea stewartii subsp. stewartii DC283]KAB0553993.1 hypothetical protein F7Q90_12435 [Pantoea stewartii subsp. stewartii]
MNLSYAARIEIPTEEDVQRITEQVMSVFPATTGSAASDGITAHVMAGEIKHRLSKLIRVEVDLVVTGKTDDSSTPLQSCAPTPIGFHQHSVTPARHVFPHFFGSFPGPI